MDTEQLLGVAMEDHFEHARVVAKDLPARRLVVAGDARLVGHLLGREGLLGLAHHGDLGDGINADRETVAQRCGLLAEHVQGRQTPLLAGGRRQRRVADDIARRIDVRHRRLEMGVGLDAAAIVCRQSDHLETETLGATHTTGRDEHHLGDQELAALQLQQRLLPIPASDLQALEPVATPEGDIHLTQLVDELINDLMVEELQGSRALVHDGHLQSQGREHGGVLDANDTGTHDHHRSRQALEIQQAVGGDCDFPVQGDPTRLGWPSTHTDEKLLRLQRLISVEPADHQFVGSNKTRRPLEHFNVIAGQRVVDHLGLTAHHPGHLAHQALHGGSYGTSMGSARFGVVLHVETPDRLPEGLRRNGARLDAHAPDTGLLFHNRYAFAQLGRLDRSSLTCGTTADTNEIKLVHEEKWRRFCE